MQAGPRVAVHRLLGVGRLRVELFQLVAEHGGIFKSLLGHGLFNLGSALSFAQVLPEGVFLAMNGRAFAWDRVRKNRETGVFEASE